MNIQQIQNILVQRMHGTLQGPVIESYVKEDAQGEAYHVLSWEVGNGTVVEKELPFGWDVQIIPGNMNKAKLVLRVSRKLLTDGTYTDGYPLMQTKITGDDQELPALYFDTVKTIVTRTKEDLPVANVADLPNPANPSGNQMYIKHQKLDDDLYLREILQKDIVFSTQGIRVDVDVKPGVKITTTTKGEGVSNLPAQGPGSTQLIRRVGAIKIYENTDVEAEARVGVYGYSTESQPWGQIVEALSYSTSITPAPGGSSEVVYDDEEIVVYRHTNVSQIVTDGSTQELDPQNWGFIQWNGTYSNLPNAGADKYRQIWSRGTFKVFLNEIATVVVGGTTIDKDPQQWGSLTWDGTFSSTINPAADRMRQVWRLGSKYVYLNELVTVNVSGTTYDKDPQQWGSVSWEGTYATTRDVNATRARQVWRLGDKQVYLNEVATPEISGTTKDKDPQQWGSITWDGVYAGTPEGDRYRQVWRLGSFTVFLNENATVEVGGSTVDKDAQQWGSITWNGVYATTLNGSADRARQVWRLGNKTVFLNETASVSVSGTSLDKDPQAWGTLTWSGVFATSSSGDRSRQVWRLGNSSVFLNETAEIAVSGSTLDKDPQSWGSLTWTGTYGTELSVGADRSRQVWRLGSKVVYLNETVAPTVSGTTKDVDPQQWGTLTWDGVYATASGGTRSRQVWRIGNYSVYLNETPNVSVSGTTQDKDPQQWGTLTWNGTYANTPSGDRFRQVWRLGASVVYLNETATPEVSGTTKDVDPQSWGSLTWNGSYGVVGDGFKTRQVWRLGSNTVFLNETPVVDITAGSFISAREQNPLITETQTSTFGTTPVTTGDNSRTRPVFSLGPYRVYENIDITVAGRGERVYPGVVNISIPAVLSAINVRQFLRRDGADSFSFEPVIQEGWSGSVPCLIRESYTTSPSGIGAPTIFKPQPVAFSTPLGGLRVAPTLHAAINLTVTIGTKHPIFLPAVHNINIPATNIPSPVGLLYIPRIDVKPYRSGFIVSRYEVQL
jgi:hypothetical protein